MVPTRARDADAGGGATAREMPVAHTVRSMVRRAAAGAALATGLVAAALAAGEHRYLREGNLLAERLTAALVDLRVCESAASCARRDGGTVFVKPVATGTEVSIYGIHSRQVAAQLVRACSETFLLGEVGDTMTVAIFELPKSQTLKSAFYARAKPSYMFLMEKAHAKH